MTTPAGWFPDPHDTSQQRYWDGAQWTDHRHPAAPAQIPSQADVAVAQDLGPTGTVFAPVLLAEPVVAEQTPSAQLVVYPPPTPDETVSYAAPGSALVSAADPLAHLRVATSGKRFGAFLLDGLVGWIPIVSFVWMMVAWTNGQTPGKSMAGSVVVVARTGHQATWGRMFLRQVIGGGLLAVCTLGISIVVSLFMIPMSKNRQAVWDKVAGTVVVDKPPVALR